MYVVVETGSETKTHNFLTIDALAEWVAEKKGVGEAIQKDATTSLTRVKEFVEELLKEEAKSKKKQFIHAEKKEKYPLFTESNDIEQSFTIDKLSSITLETNIVGKFEKIQHEYPMPLIKPREISGNFTEYLKEYREFKPNITVPDSFLLSVSSKKDNNITEKFEQIQSTYNMEHGTNYFGKHEPIINELSTWFADNFCEKNTSDISPAFNHTLVELFMNNPEFITSHHYMIHKPIIIPSKFNFLFLYNSITKRNISMHIFNLIIQNKMKIRSDRFILYHEISHHTTSELLNKYSSKDNIAGWWLSPLLEDFINQNFYKEPGSNVQSSDIFFMWQKYIEDFKIQNEEFKKELREESKNKKQFSATLKIDGYISCRKSGGIFYSGLEIKKSQTFEPDGYELSEYENFD